MSVKYLSLLMFSIIVLFGNILVNPTLAKYNNQQPTVAIPTVTGTPSGPIATVLMDREQINIRSGPDVSYPKVGILLAGQKVPALGRTAGGSWIQIAYPGAPGGVAWVFTNLVNLSPGNIPIVESPPTPTPRVTPTIDPTLASQFQLIISPSRLPTYTPASGKLAYDISFPEDEQKMPALPIGLIIIGTAVVGFFGAAISLIRGR